MLDFADKASEEDFDDVDVESLIKAGWNYIINGETSCLSGMGFKAFSLISDRETKEKFWEYWRILADTIEVVSPDKDYMDGELFTCSC